ncbi:MAG: ECF transporter S component [Clostridia bacterium]|nr:ECF transporter S component [Clostridia bacterium]
MPRWKIFRLTLTAILTALVVILQFVSNISSAFLPVSITLTLVPVVIGAVSCHPLVGAWLGFVGGVTILLTGAGEPFFTFNPAATIFIVLLKGILSGLAAGYISRFLRRNRTVSIFAAAAIAPIINTGIFFVGCSMFFMDLVSEWAGSQNVAIYMFTALAGINFVLEFAFNIILAPTIKRILDASILRDYNQHKKEMREEYIQRKRGDII